MWRAAIFVEAMYKTESPFPEAICFLNCHLKKIKNCLSLHLKAFCLECSNRDGHRKQDVHGGVFVQGFSLCQAVRLLVAPGDGMMELMGVLMYLCRSSDSTRQAGDESPNQQHLPLSPEISWHQRLLKEHFRTLPLSLSLSLSRN